MQISDLKKALSEYTEGDKKETGIPQEEAVALLQEKYEIVSGMMHGFKYKPFFKASTKEKMVIITQAMEYIFKQDKGKERYLKYVSELSKAFTLAVPHESALKIKDDVGFFQAVRSAIAKNTETIGKGTYISWFEQTHPKHLKYCLEKSLKHGKFARSLSIGVKLYT